MQLSSTSSSATRRQNLVAVRPNNSSLQATEPHRKDTIKLAKTLFSGRTGPLLISRGMVAGDHSASATYEPNPSSKDELMHVNYTKEDTTLKVNLQRQFAQQDATLFAVLQAPQTGKVAHVELAKTKGDRVLVVTQKGVTTSWRNGRRPIAAILRNVPESTTFQDPKTKQTTLTVDNVYSSDQSPQVIPTYEAATVRLWKYDKANNTAVKQVFIAAAGDGTRIRPYADCKALTELVGGVTMIESLVDQLAHQGVERIGISVRTHMASQFEKVLKPWIKAGKVQLVLENGAYGDASGVVKALNTSTFIKSDQPLMIAFADAITEINLGNVSTKWDKLDNPYVALITRPTPAGSVIKKYGYAVTEAENPNADGKISSFGEKPKSLSDIATALGQDSIKKETKVAANTGMALLSPECLKDLQEKWTEYHENAALATPQEKLKFYEVFQNGIKDGKGLYVTNMTDDEQWLDGGNASDLAEGRAAILKGEIGTSTTLERVRKYNLSEAHPGVFFNKGTKKAAISWNPHIHGNVDFIALPDTAAEKQANPLQRFIAKYKR